MTTPKANNKMQKNVDGAESEQKFWFTPGQMMALNASTLIGVGVLTLPRSATESASQFGWLSVLLALLLSLIAVWMMNLLNRRFPGKTMVEYGGQVLGSRRHAWVGRVLNAPAVMSYFVYWLLATAIVARVFGEVVVTAVLTNTPLEVIVGTMLLLGFTLAYYDPEVVARVNEVLLLIIVVPVVVISISAYQNARVDYIMPLYPDGHWMKVLFGIMPAMTSFLGFEVSMMFNGHFGTKKDNLRAQLLGVIVAGFVYLLIVIAGIMSFGYEEMARQAWPTLELIKTVKVPGLILERTEAVFLGVWVAAVFTTAGNWFYCTNWSLQQLFGIKKYRRLTPVVLVSVAYVFAMYPENILDLFKILDLIAYLGLFVCFIQPCLMLLIAAFRKIDDRKAHTEGETQREAG